MTTYFTSDQHFGHARIIDMCARPFDNVDAMDRDMINAWNSVVRPGDTVWHVGDFAYRVKPNRLEWIFHQLYGTKHLVAGNHDGAETMALPWASVSQLQVIRLDGQRVTMCHYALPEWRISTKTASIFSDTRIRGCPALAAASTSASTVSGSRR